MHSTIEVRVCSLGIVLFGLAGACGASGRAGAHRSEPVTTAAPELGGAWPAPACTDEAVPIHEAPIEGFGSPIADGGRLYMVGSDPSTIEVAWEWGGPRAVLARGPADRAVHSFAVDDRYVYWSISASRFVTPCLPGLGGAIYRVPKAGGPVETIVEAAGEPEALQIDRGRVYWRDRGLCPKDINKPTPRFIKRWDPASRAVTTIIADDGLSELIVDAGTLWMLANDEVVQTDADGGERKVLARTTAGHGLLVTKDRLFVTMNPDAEPNYVAEIPRAGGAPHPVLWTHNGVKGLAADADTLYVTDMGGELLATPLAGGSVEVVATGVSFAGFAGDRLLVWVGNTLESMPRTQRLGEMIASNQTKPGSMAIDREALYWVTLDAVWRRPLTGGDAMRLTDDLGFSDRIALTDDKIVVADDGADRHGPGRVGVVPTTGGAVKWLATDLDTPLEIAATSTDAIYGDGGGTIWRVPLAGGAPVQLAKGTGGHVETVITDGKTVYFSNYDSYDVYAVSLRGGGKVITVGRAVASPMSLVLDDRDLVIATQFGEIQRVAATGGMPRTIARAEGVPRSLARDATHLYWITREAIERVPRGGGIKQRIGAGATGVLAVGDDHVFWSDDTYLGTIRRAAKRPVGAVSQSSEPETGPLAVAGNKVYVGTRTDVRELDLATGEFPEILALHRTPQWVGTNGATVFALADDKIWAIDVAAARKERLDRLAKTPRSTGRELAFDSDFTPPASTSPIGVFGRAVIVGDAVVWTAGDRVHRLGKTGGQVQTLASGLDGLDWIARDAAGTVYVTARDGAAWAVYALGAAGTQRAATIDREPRGFAVDANGFVLSTDTEVVRLPHGGGAPAVLAANQHGAGPVSVGGGAVYWMTRDGILTTDGTGCGAHRIARWPSAQGILAQSSLVATDSGAVFTDVSTGTVVTVRKH